MIINIEASSQVSDSKELLFTHYHLKTSKTEPFIIELGRDSNDTSRLVQAPERVTLFALEVYETVSGDDG